MYAFLPGIYVMQLLWMAISPPYLWKTTRASGSPIQSSVNFADTVVHLRLVRQSAVHCACLV